MYLRHHLNLEPQTFDTELHIPRPAYCHCHPDLPVQSLVT